ncbi:MAG: hypothetical protein AB1760_19455 [Pseudomonadota bacterium]
MSGSSPGERGAGLLRGVDTSTGAAIDFGLTQAIAGPAADSGRVLWQDELGQACLASLSGQPPFDCLPLAAAERLDLSGRLGVSTHAGGTIRLLNFDTGRTRVIDSTTNAGGRYDAVIEDGTAVWIRERGYAGKYYEPLVTGYDVATDTLAYATQTGGGAGADGQSLYERRAPVLRGGRIFYQQRLRAGAGWDIFEAASGTFGAPVVDLPGDQVSPDADDGLLVYQDNRSGDWDIYGRDLETGADFAVCTEPGDQVAPRIDGGLVVWEDLRSGDWDVRGARLSRQAPQPALTLTLRRAFWASYDDYQARTLTVGYSLMNTGAGPAHAVEIRHESATPSGVSPLGGGPAPVTLLSGEEARADRRYFVPQGVTRFRTSVFASCRDGAGSELWFPGPPPLL